MSSEQLTGILPLVLLVVIFWFLILRPARKRQRDVAQVQHTMEPGSRVMLTSGVYGTIESVDDEDIALQIAPGTTIQVHRQAVAKVIPPDVPDSDPQPEGVDDTNDEQQ